MDDKCVDVQTKIASQIPFGSRMAEDTAPHNNCSCKPVVEFGMDLQRRSDQPSFFSKKDTNSSLISDKACNQSDISCRKERVYGFTTERKQFSKAAAAESQNRCSPHRNYAEQLSCVKCATRSKTLNAGENISASIPRAEPTPQHKTAIPDVRPSPPALPGPPLPAALSLPSLRDVLGTQPVLRFDILLPPVLPPVLLPPPAWPVVAAAAGTEHGGPSAPGVPFPCGPAGVLLRPIALRPLPAHAV